MTLTGVAVMSATSTPALSLRLRRDGLLWPPTTPSLPSRPRGMRRFGMNMSMSISSEVALKPESESESSTSDPAESEELKRKLEQVGSRVRLKAPLRVYHVPRVPEVELPAGTEGFVKQYVGFWKGKRISANFPYKIEFQIDVPGRGPIKFFAHLKEDEFDLI